MKAAHRRANEANSENDLISDRKGDLFENVAAEQGCEHICDRQHDVSNTCHMCPIFDWNCLGEEGIEANTQWRKGKRHQKGQDNNGSDLIRSVEYPGEEYEGKEANAINDRCPEDSA